MSGWWERERMSFAEGDDLRLKRDATALLAACEAVAKLMDFEQCLMCGEWRRLERPIDHEEACPMPQVLAVIEKAEGRA